VNDFFFVKVGMNHLVGFIKAFGRIQCDMHIFSEFFTLLIYFVL